MISLEHRVRVFVFHFATDQVHYLLLRHKPRDEWPIGPIVGPIGMDEHMDDAIVRQVREETGIRRPHHIMDLTEPSKELFGDIGLVEWPYAYQAGLPGEAIEKIEPGPTVSEIHWLRFEEAFQTIETRRDREALVRLQLRLAS